MEPINLNSTHPAWPYPLPGHPEALPVILDLNWTPVIEQSKDHPESNDSLPL